MASFANVHELLATRNNIEGERLIGRVKWFNNKAGYGFITVTDGFHSGTDVFVHHTAIKSDGYRTLEEGQEVEFEIQQGPKGEQAVNVTKAA